jgi:hypothetical protein
MRKVIGASELAKLANLNKYVSNGDISVLVIQCGLRSEYKHSVAAAITKFVDGVDIQQQEQTKESIDKIIYKAKNNNTIQSYNRDIAARIPNVPLSTYTRTTTNATEAEQSLANIIDTVSTNSGVALDASDINKIRGIVMEQGMEQAGFLPNNNNKWYATTINNVRLFATVDAIVDNMVVEVKNRKSMRNTPIYDLVQCYAIMECVGSDKMQLREICGESVRVSVIERNTDMVRSACDKASYTIDDIMMKPNGKSIDESIYNNTTHLLKHLDKNNIHKLYTCTSYKKMV